LATHRMEGTYGTVDAARDVLEGLSEESFGIGRLHDA
jgi:hypothetical protein